MNGTIDLQHLLRKFIQGLRVSRIFSSELKIDFSTMMVFDLNKTILIYDFPFFKESECSGGEFYIFMFKYVVMELWGEVLHYDKQTNTIMFYEKFHADLDELMTFSFDLMKFGDFSKLGYQLIDITESKVDRDLEDQYQQYSNFYKISILPNMNNLFFNPN